MSSPAKRILVIKLSSLGDFIQALGSFKAIRTAHQGAHITLLTTKPFVPLAEACGYFDAVWCDKRVRYWQPLRILAFARQLRQGRFDRVYDLQWSQRSSSYLHLFGKGKVEWVGPARQASHRYDDNRRDRHIMTRHAEMLAQAGVAGAGLPDTSFMTADLSAFDLPARVALLVPGSSPHRLIKRWPAEHFATLAQKLIAAGVTPLLLGGPSEAQERATICRLCPAARDLGGRTSLAEIVALGRQAEIAVGNDTGPTHLVATSGCPTIALFCEESDPVKARPPGPRVTVLQEQRLADLSLTRVWDTVAAELAAKVQPAVP
ncbi:MAG: glycosyltransferase family 9 protein [Kiloniellaceae bacterium]